MTYRQLMQSLSDESLSYWLMTVSDCSGCIEEAHGCKHIDPESLCEKQYAWLRWLQRNVPEGDYYGPG